MTLAGDLAAFAARLRFEDLPPLAASTTELAPSRTGSTATTRTRPRRARRPLAPQAIVEKFRDNAARVLGAAAVRRLEEVARALDALPDVGGAHGALRRVM